MTSLPSHERKRASGIALVGCCPQVPLALWLRHMMVLLWAGSEPFGYNWRQFALIAAAAFLVQLLWLRSRRWAESHSGNYLWLPVFWACALVAI